MAEQAVGGKFEPVVDGIECAKTGQRGTVVQRLVAPVCFGDKDGARLGLECDQIGRGARRDEHRQYDAGHGRVKTASVNAGPQCYAKQHIRGDAVDADIVEGLYSATTMVAAASR